MNNTFVATGHTTTQSYHLRKYLIEKKLDEYKDAQLNLASDAARVNLALEIVNAIHSNECDAHKQGFLKENYERKKEK